MRLPVTLLSTTLLLASGCTAGIATARIAAADKAVREARAAGAEELAPYEYTLATSYLREAWRVSGEAAHGDGITLAKEAKAFAEAAVVRVQRGGPTLAPIQDPEVLSDAPATPTDREPAPAREKPEDDFDDFLDEDIEDEDAWESP